MNIPIQWKPVQVNESLACHPLLQHAQRVLPGKLHKRLHAFMNVAEEDGILPQLYPAIDCALHEHTRPFVASEYTACINPHLNTMALCQTIESLQQTFPNVSPILWRGLAAICVREEPEVEKTIIEVQHELPYAWCLIDAALHALGKSYALNFHVQSAIFERTGLMLMHGCGCNHYMASVRDAGGSINFQLPPDQHTIATQEWFDHFWSELYLIIVNGLPFRMNPPEHESTATLAGGHPVYQG
jgi:hypothetical protein